MGKSHQSLARRLVSMATLSLMLLAVAGVGVPASAEADQGRYLDPVFGNPEVQYNIAYGQAVNADDELEILKLDLYQPPGDNAPTRPVMIWVHGGAFTSGDKGQERNIIFADAFARRGWVSAAINFRIDGSERHATDDLQAAVRWFRAHADDYRIDTQRIVVVGPSSGAVSALHTNFNPEDPGESGNPGYPSNVAGAVSISGNVQNNSMIGPGEPPIAMIHAADDITITYASAARTCGETQADGNVCEMYTYPTGGHPPGFMLANHAQIVEQSSDFVCRNVLGVDARGYTCDTDDDNDGLADAGDACPQGAANWPSGQTTDRDGDGCKDDGEDGDDDNDSVTDAGDTCSRGATGWSSAQATDHDGDGCKDDAEDADDDDDRIGDASDACPRGAANWPSGPTTDRDADGCKDDAEDGDDDSDSVADSSDACPRGATGWTSGPTTDQDGDGCRDDGEDADSDNDGIGDPSDACPAGATGWASGPITDRDGDGCKDDAEDTDDDADSVADASDRCPRGVANWASGQTTDRDADGCKDDTEDANDDNDSVADPSDACPRGATGWTSGPNTDRDRDGCKDDSEDADDDADRIGDPSDACPRGATGWASGPITDRDGDGCKDNGEDTDDDNDARPDAGDACPFLVGDATNGCPSHPRSISLRYSNAARAFKGNLRSARPRCKGNQLVILRRRRPGPDPKIGQDMTDSTGLYVIPAARNPGRYYAKAPWKTRPAVGNCLPATSPNLTLN